MAWRALQDVWHDRISSLGSMWSLGIMTGGAAVLGGVCYYLTQRMKKANLHPDVLDPNKGRPLAIGEAMCLSWCNRGRILLSNVLLVASKKPVRGEDVLKSLERLADIHPLLRMRIEYRRGQPWFVPMENFKVEYHESKDTRWVKAAEDELLHGYNPENGPLWRVTFLPEADIDRYADGYEYKYGVVFGLNHCLADGISYMHLFNTFLTELGAVLDGKPRQSELLPLFPPLDDFVEPLLKETFGEKFGRLLFWIRVNIPWLRAKYIAPLLDQPPNPFVQKMGVEITRNPNAEKRTCFLPYVLDRMKTSKLVKVCRENKITVQAAIQAANAIAVARLVSDHCQLDGQYETRSAVTVNVRKFFGKEIDPRHLGCYLMVTLMGVSAVASDGTTAEKFWKVAQTADETLKTHLDNKMYMWYYKLACKYSVIANLTDAELAEAEKEQEYKQGRFATTSYFTNLGNCTFLDRPEDSTVKLLGRYGASAEHKTGCIFGHNMVTFEGKMHINILYYSNVTSRDIAVQYASNFFAALNVAMGEG